MANATRAPQSHEQHPGHPGVPTDPQTQPQGSPETHDGPPQVEASPVAELRNAAAKLRKHIKHATDSPWVTSSVWSPRATSTSAVYSHAHPAGTVESEVVASGRIRSRGCGGIREPWNAEYIALMQPSVGAALAEFLEIEADVAAEIWRHSPDLTRDQLAAHVHGALTIARALNAKETAR